MTTYDENSAAIDSVTVLGLGDMGSAIARTFIDRGYRTTVWNRTSSKTVPLVEAGAVAVDTAGEAVAASPLVIICLLDSAAVDDVLATLDGAVDGKALINVTSGSPEHSRETERWVTERGAAFVDGKIMGDPPYIGTPNVMLGFSGAEVAFKTHHETLQHLGTVTYHGADPGAAAVEFLAQVAVGYELLIGFLHVLRLVRAEGFDVAAFTDRVGGSLPGYPPLLAAFATAITSGDYGPDLGPLKVQAALMDDLISHRESLGVEAVRMREVKDLMDRRIAEGHGDQGFSSLFELLADRPTSASA